MNTKNFGNGYVGIKINSISEIMKYNALKEQFSIWNEYEGTLMMMSRLRMTMETSLNESRQKTRR